MAYRRAVTVRCVRRDDQIDRWRRQGLHLAHGPLREVIGGEVKRGVAAVRSASLRATTGGGGPQAPPTRTTSLPPTRTVAPSSRGSQPPPTRPTSLRATTGFRRPVSSV